MDICTVEVTRGGRVESRHAVQVVLIDAEGSGQAWGDPDRPTMARSAVKAFQALPLVATGAADEIGLSVEELALACASHSGEPNQVAGVESVLARIGCSAADLECGTAPPLGEEPARDWIRAGCPSRPLVHCCSGKHAGVLATAVHHRERVIGYIAPDHPAQQRVTAALAAVTRVPLTAPPGVDGCGFPVHTVALSALARGMARLVEPSRLPAELAAAAPRIVAAARLGYWVSGPGRYEALTQAAAERPVLIKSGAEGVMLGALPGPRLGFALKAEDGAPRAVEAATSALLARLGVLSTAAHQGEPAPIRNAAGVTVGEVRARLDSIRARSLP
ncbi:MAG: asparaginase [Acidimicrobiales bacterium]